MELVYIVLSIVILLKITYIVVCLDDKIDPSQHRAEMLSAAADVLMTVPNFILLVFIFYKLYK